MFAALEADHTQRRAGDLTSALDAVPADLRGKAISVQVQLERFDETLAEVRDAAKAATENQAGDEHYLAEHAAKVKLGRRVEVARTALKTRDNLLGNLEVRAQALLNDLSEKAQPLPLKGSPELQEMRLLSAKQDLREALAKAPPGYMAEAAKRLQQEALENGEAALAWAIGADPSTERYIRTHGTPQDQREWEEIRDELVDNVSDPAAKPYRQAYSQLKALRDLKAQLESTWDVHLEQVGLLDDDVRRELAGR